MFVSYRSLPMSEGAPPPAPRSRQATRYRKAAAKAYNARGTHRREPRLIAAGPAQTCGRGHGNMDRRDIAPDTGRDGMQVIIPPASLRGKTAGRKPAFPCGTRMRRDRVAL